MATLQDLLDVLKQINDREAKQDEQRKKAEEAKASKPAPSFADNVAGFSDKVQGHLGKVRSLFSGNFNELPKLASNFSKMFESTEGASTAASAAGTTGATGAATAASTAGAGAGAAEAGGGLVAGALAIPGLGEVVAVVAGAAALAGAIAAAVKAVQDMATAFFESYRKFAEFSGELAGTFNKWDMFQQMFNMNMGDALAQGGGLDFLEEKLEELSTTLLPYIAAFTNVAAYILGGLVWLTNALIELFEGFMLMVAGGLDTITLHVMELEKTTKGVLAQIRSTDKETALNQYVISGARPIIERQVGPQRNYL